MREIDLREVPVFFINLDENQKRRQCVKKEMEKAGFKSVTRVKGVIKINPSTGQPDGATGCSAAHLSVLREQKPPFIILEDDCIIKKFVPVIKIPVDSDAVYLGNSIWSRLNCATGLGVIVDPVNKELVRVYNMLSGHAILFLTDDYCSMCRRAGEYASNIFGEYGNIDIGYAEIQKYFKVYAFDDPLFLQTSNPGSTNKTIMSKPHKGRLRLGRSINKDATT